jgi:hypothetical protein
MLEPTIKNKEEMSDAMASEGTSARMFGGIPAYARARGYS